MSATLVSSNTTIKVNGAVAAGNAGSVSSGTLYTAPSNGYAIIHIYKEATGGNAYFTIASRQLNTAATTALLPVNTGMAFYVGPSQVVAWASSTLESANVLRIWGVEFINTP